MFDLLSEILDAIEGIITSILRVLQSVWNFISGSSKNSKNAQNKRELDSHNN